MAVRMRGVDRPMRIVQRQIGRDGGEQVDPGLESIGQQADRARERIGERLDGDRDEGGQYGK